MNLQTPIARVRGLGPARQGTHHWWYQRITSIALIPLSIWFIGSLLRMTSSNFTTVSQWLQSPLAAILLILFVVTLFFHAQLGMQVVIEDYISQEWQKIACLILIKFIAVIAALASVFAVLTVFLGL